MAWYTLTVHGDHVVALLSAHQVATLLDHGFELEPASRPATLAERIGRGLASLAELGPSTR